MSDPTNPGFTSGCFKNTAEIMSSVHAFIDTWSADFGGTMINPPFNRAVQLINQQK